MLIASFSSVGVNAWDGDAPPKYINSTHLSARVGNLNPAWNQDQSEEASAKGFAAAMALAGSEFADRVDYFATSWLPARSLVQADLEARKSIDPSGKIVKLTSYCPWKEHLHQLEEEMGAAGEIIYVLYEVRRSPSCRMEARQHVLWQQGYLILNGCPCCLTSTISTISAALWRRSFCEITDNQYEF